MKGTATVIFDFDGTLANSVELVFTLYNEHVEQFGYLPIKKDEFSVLRRLGYKKSMKAKKVKMRLLPKMIMTIGKEMRQRMDEVEPYEGITDVLKQLHEDGFAVGVLTSNQAPLVKEFFKRHNFPEFDFIVSEKTLFGKDKAIKRIMHRFNLQKDQVIYVGDEPRDVVASHKAKIPVVGVTWGLAGNEGFEKDEPDYLVHSPIELLKTLRAIAQE